MLSLFLARAVFVLSVLPPLEGWDEYQHIAHIAYIVEHGRSPVLGVDNRVPRSLYPGLVSLPHSRLGGEQLTQIGARDYRTFWEGGRPTVSADAGPVALYQAQQAPLYYWLMAPVWRLLRGSENLLAVVTMLRLLNVCLGAGAVVLALGVVGRMVNFTPARYGLGMLISLQPLFLLNAARVANDALAVFLSTLVVAVLLVLLQKHFWPSVAGAGLAMGLAVLAKATSLTLIPFIILVFILGAWRGRMSVRQTAAGALIFFGLALAVTSWYFRENHARFGVLTPLQEAVLNHKAGKTITDLVDAAWQIRWWRSFRPRCFEYSMWFGGWSWLQPPKLLRRVYAFSLYIALLGLCLGFRKDVRRPRLLFGDTALLWQVAALPAAAFAGLGYHTLHTQLAWGAVAANSWYAAAAFPWMLCLCYQGACFYPGRWAARILTVILAAVYSASEIYGTLGLGVPTYTGHAWGPVARDRLAQVHVSGMGPELTFPSLSLVLFVVLIAASTWFVAERSPPPGQPPGAASLFKS